MKVLIITDYEYKPNVQVSTYIFVFDGRCMNRNWLPSNTFKNTFSLIGFVKAGQEILSTHYCSIHI